MADGEGTRSRAASRNGRVRRAVGLVLLVAVAAAVQSHTAWQFDQPGADESEVVHFAVGMLGGDLDPGWYDYGPVNMHLLAGIYWVIGQLGVLLGIVSGTEDYARELFRSGHFIQVARYVYACIGVATVATLALAARRAAVPRSIVAGWAVVVLLSPHARTYANVVRVDTLVALVAVGVAVVAARERVTRWSLVGSAALVAVAVSVKVNAAALGVVPLWLGIRGMRRGELSLRDVVVAAWSGGLALLLVSPTINPLVTVFRAFQFRVDEGVFRYGAPVFDTPWDRAARVVEQVADGVPPPLLLLALCAVLADGPRRRLALGLGGVLVAITLPFLATSDLPPYWFVPQVALVNGLALVGAAALWTRLRSAIEGQRRRALVESGIRTVAVLAVAGLAIPSVAAVVGDHREAGTPTNRELAAAWLVENRPDEVPVLGVGPRHWMLPRYYDPTEPTEARALSRAFIYGRWDHPFLNRVFLGWLEEEHAQQVRLPVDSYLQLSGVRLSLREGAPSAVVGLRACRGDTCERLDGGADITVPAGEEIEISGLSLPGDRTVELEVDGRTDGATIDLILDTPSQPAVLYYPRVDGTGVRRYPVYLPKPRGRTRYFELDTLPLGADTGDVNELVDRPSWVVTAPIAYERFLDLDLSAVPAERRDDAELVTAVHVDLVSQERVAVFDEGLGSPIEIYLVEPTGDPDSTARGEATP